MLNFIKNKQNNTQIWINNFKTYKIKIKLIKNNLQKKINLYKKKMIIWRKKFYKNKK